MERVGLLNDKTRPIHVLLDIYSTHKNARVQGWPTAHAPILAQLQFLFVRCEMAVNQAYLALPAARGVQFRDCPASRWPLSLAQESRGNHEGAQA